MSKRESLVRVTVAYVIALAVASAWLIWGPDTRQLWLDALIADVLATLVIFAASRLHKNSSFYDAYWSVVPPFLLLYWWASAGADVPDARVILVALVVLAWAIRLTGNWVYSFPGLHHEDWRYPMLRERAGRFELIVDLVAIHLIPTFQVFLGSLPIYLAVTRTGQDVIDRVPRLVPRPPKAAR